MPIIEDVYILYILCIRFQSEACILTCVRMLCDAEPSPSITAGPLNPFLPDRLHLLYRAS